MSENDFECLASTGVKKPVTMFPSPPTGGLCRVKAECDFEGLQFNLQQGSTDQRVTGGLHPDEAHGVNVLGPTIVHFPERTITVVPSPRCVRSERPISALAPCFE